MMDRKALILGIKGTKLLKSETNLIRREKPWGIILFSRNIKSIYQLKKLIRSIRSVFNDENYPILIDEEGGKVSRLSNIVDFSVFSQEYFGKTFTSNKKNFTVRYKIYINKVCEILNETGINIVTSPVLDVRRKISNNIVGSRSFSRDPNVIIYLGKLCINLFNQNKIGTVMKHIPGHGLSNFDSHYKLPVISGNKKNLISKDFRTFKNCNSIFAMTAHIVYQVFDRINAATHSKKIISKIIRKYMGFKGILISDDISMKALKYGLEKNALKALKAGCNIVLHCNGNIIEMKRLAKIIPTTDKFTLKKTSQFYKFLG